MPNDLSDLLLWRRRRGAPSWLLRDPDTGGLPALDIDYAGGRAFKAGSVVDLAGLHTVSRASGGYAENLDGSLTWFGNNVMRRTDRGVLVEGARTNLLLRSQELENASWSKNNATITANAATAPDGTVTADLIAGSTGSGGYAQQQVTQTSGVTDVASLYVKAGSVSWVRLSIFSNSAHAATWFNLSGAGSVGTNAVGNTATIAALANGWYRISISRTTGGANPYWSFFPCASDAANCAVGNSAYIWGAQLVAAAFPSSYIPTGASTATRAADNTSFPDIGFFNTAAGTLIIDAVQNKPLIADGIRSQLFGVVDSGNNRFALRGFDNGVKPAFVLGNGVANSTLNSVASYAMGVPYKVAAAYSAAGAALCGNAETPLTNLTVWVPPAFSSIYVGDGMFGYIRRLTYFDRRISNAGLQALTA